MDPGWSDGSAKGPAVHSPGTQVRSPEHIKDETKQQQQHLGVIPGICSLSTERWEVETGGLWGLNGQQEQPTTGQCRGGGRIPTAFRNRCIYVPTPSHNDMHNPPPQVWTDPES